MPAGVRRALRDEPDHGARWLGLGLAAVYAGLVVLQFRAFFQRFTTHLIGDHGDALLQHLHCAWQWTALAEGRFGELLRLPTLHPYSSGLAFGEPLLGVTLPFAPLYLITGSSPATYNTALVAAFLLLGFAVFLWVRELFDSPAAGLLAAVLVVFVPWRLQLLTNLNNMTVHFAVLGAWLLTRWAREPRPTSLLGAALCFHVQLITSAQVAVVSIYLTGIWFAVVWLASGLRFERRRALQLTAASALFLILAWPWWSFFQEAFEAARGLPRTREMQMFSSPFGAMARQFGLLGPLGAMAVLSLPALFVAAREKRLPDGATTHLLGLCLGAAVLFVCGRGPYWSTASQSVNPGYHLTQWLPLLSAYRAPIRLAAFTPIVAAVLAGGGFAALLANLRVSSARWRVAWLCAPLLLVPLWPSLGTDMGAPIRERPADLALARALAELPRDAVILPLPVDLDPSGAAVDERVLIHRRAQIGGFASLIPPVFRSAISELGQWPSAGHEIIATLGVTHVVAPDAWVVDRSDELERHGYRLVTRRGGHAIVAAPTAAPAHSATSTRLLVPPAAAAGRWLTLAIFEDPARFHRRGHQVLTATWHASDGAATDVEALAILPGVVSRHRPIRLHVPTPEAPGLARLEIASELVSVSKEVSIEARPTSFDAPIGPIDVTLAADFAQPASVRASAAFPVDVELSAAGGPILLASSREALPFRRGETLVLARYRPARGNSGIFATPGLSADLVPGTGLSLRWHLATPAVSGIYDLEVSFLAHGAPTLPAPWVRLISGLHVVAD
ncbi:MAG: hypothetical protein JRH16_04265 [Deltaproteobacteria bacterium]|nr:hypothetical protein [Deltaproteobacteria bacterium]MBW2359851.1 hypothetical protein [Deltaproteobacteria bacterium]